MCIGQGAYQAQVANYKRSIKEREVKWAGARNVWSAKLARYDTQKNENVLAYSRQIGAIQRDFGLEKDKFLKNNEDAYRKLVQSRTVNEGGRARGFGRANSLSYLYADAGRTANMRRKGVQQEELMRASGRQLLTMQNRALTNLGTAPIPGLAPVKPARPSQFEFLINTAQTAVGLATGVGGGYKALTGNTLFS